MTNKIDELIKHSEVCLRFKEQWGDSTVLLIKLALATLQDHKNGCVVLPSKLTAEDGFKAELSGEFRTDNGSYVSWCNIKDIHEMAVEVRPKSNVDKIIEGLGE